MSRSQPRVSPKSKPAFADSAASAGLAYRWTIPGKRPLNILQTIGNGCAFLDYDRDGDLDILLVGKRIALYKGDGLGRFTDVSRQSGLTTLAGDYRGCAVGDYDNDGFPDVYVSAYRGGDLLHNERPRSGRAVSARVFRKVTREAGIGAQPWGTSCSFVDLDGDGRLDLYIANYVSFGPHTHPQLCDSHGILTSCGPGIYPAERGAVYRNMGAGRFASVTTDWSFDRVSGKTLGVAASAPTASGRPRLALSNDQVPANLLCWQGSEWVDNGTAAGMSRSRAGTVIGGMGIDWGDYDNDGKFDLVIGTYQNQAKEVFRATDAGFEAQDVEQMGMLSSVPWVTFGAKWVDYDNDGWLDLLFASGHVQDNIPDADLFVGPGSVYRQPLVLYRNRRGRFEDVSDRLDAGALRPIVGRGLATGDYDSDGKVDALVVDSEGSPILLHNVVSDGGHWLAVSLEGRRCNRDGYGAVLSVKAGGRTFTQFCHADGSYASSSDKRVHFGLGASTRIDALRIVWPDGHTDTFTGIPVDRQVAAREGSRYVRLLWPSRQ